MNTNTMPEIRVLTKAEKEKAWRQANPEKVRQYRLIRKRTISQKQTTDGMALAEVLMQCAHSSASGKNKSRNIRVGITKQYVYDMLKNSNAVCAISGLTMNALPNNPYRVSIDRIDSSLGYIHGNVQLVCKMVNNAKSNLDDDTFKVMIKALFQKQIKE
jgi:hypothetical protein